MTNTEASPPLKLQEIDVKKIDDVNKLDIDVEVDENDAEPIDDPQQENADPPNLVRTLAEWILIAIIALGISLLIRSFLMQAYYIPSTSMAPTLQGDDRVLVNKLSYRFGDVGYGDVIVFARPANAPGTINDFIKRVIALPGDTVSFAGGQVYVNGEPLDEPYVNGSPTYVNGRVMNCANETYRIDTCLVPSGMVFVMGDNRLASTDSRFFGPIEMDSIVGRAFIKIWPPGSVGLL